MGRGARRGGVGGGRWGGPRGGRPGSATDVAGEEAELALFAVHVGAVRADPRARVYLSRRVEGGRWFAVGGCGGGDGDDAVRRFAGRDCRAQGDAPVDASLEGGSSELKRPLRCQELKPEPAGCRKQSPIPYDNQCQLTFS